MKSDQETPNRFEDRLLVELRQFVAAQPAPPPVASSSTRPNPFTRTPVRVAMAGASVLAVASVAIAIGHDPAEPAYAVQSQAGGAVDVEIKSLRDAAGLREAFDAQGIDAVVRYLPAGKMCVGEPGGAETHSLDGQSGDAGAESQMKVHRSDDGQPGLNTDGTPPPDDAESEGSTTVAQHTADFVQHTADGSTRFRLSPGSVPEGKTLVIEGNVGDGPSSLSIRVQKRPVEQCELADLPAGPEAGN
jgi:hypothetical protein